jgi:hypothetical protein
MYRKRTMNSEIIEAVAARIAEAPRLPDATKNERQAAFRARAAGLKLLSKAAAVQNCDGRVLLDLLREHGIEVARGSEGLSILAEGNGLEVRRNIVCALRTYLRPHYQEQRRHAIRAYNAARPSRKKEREERRAQLAAMGIDLARFREVCEVIDRTR